MDLIQLSTIVAHATRTSTRANRWALVSCSTRGESRFGVFCPAAANTSVRCRYMFTEVLAPALLAGLLLWYTLEDVFALIGKVAEAVVVYLREVAQAFKDTVAVYAGKLLSNGG